MEIPRRRRARVNIEMSPLIDCIFQLLIFFMLSSTFLTPSIRLTLPQAGGASRPESDPIMVRGIHVSLNLKYKPGKG